MPWRKIAVLQWLASVIYTTILFLDSLAFGLVIVLLGWLPFRQRYGLARAWANTNIWLAKFLCGLEWIVEGREHIPREGAHVTMWKHTSAWETRSADGSCSLTTGHGPRTGDPLDPARRLGDLADEVHRH